jgi:hypothetical protein
MCLPDTPKNRAVVQENIRQWADKMDEIINGAIKIEDIYREAAVLYHGTLMAARQPGEYPAPYLETCKAFFELSCTSEYEAIFKSFHDTIAALVDLRSRHVRYSGTLMELCHRLQVNLQPVFFDLLAKARQFRRAIEDSLEYAKDLEKISEERFNGKGLNAWYRPYDPFLGLSCS